MPESLPPVPVESFASRIFLDRGQKVILDSGPAELYGVKKGSLRFRLHHIFLNPII
ncbi:MAG: hypothetical protein ACYC9S_01200 [Leptospirales bacterium]